MKYADSCEDCIFYGEQEFCNKCIFDEEEIMKRLEEE